MKGKNNLKASKQQVVARTTSSALSIKRFELIVKLLLFKFGYEADIFIEGPNNCVLQLQTLPHMFFGRMEEIKRKCSKTFITDCKRILAINEQVNKDSSCFAQYRKELLRILNIAEEYLVYYSYDDHPAENLLEGNARTTLLLEYAKVVGQFPFDMDIKKAIEFQFQGITYATSPLSVINDLNYPPLYDEVSSLIESFYEDPGIKSVFDFELRLATVLWRFGKFMEVPMGKTISLHNAEPECQLILSDMPMSKTKATTTKMKRLPSPVVTPKIATEAVRFVMNTHVPLRPSFPSEMRNPNSPANLLNITTTFASNPEYFAGLHQRFLTPEMVKPYGESMLKTACFHNNIKLVRRLIELKVDPKLNDKIQVPALLCVAMGGSTEILEILIKCGVSISDSIYANFNIYDVALIVENYAFAMYLQQHHPYVNYFKDLPMDVLSISMSMRNQHAILSLVLKFGFVPTDLHLRAALLQGQINTFDTLLRIIDDKHLNYILLQEAVYSNCLPQTESLLKRKMDPNLLTEKGYSLLSLTVSLGFRTMTKLLLAYRANPDIIDKGGLQPIGRATLAGSVRIVADLIEAGANHRILVNKQSLFELAVARQHVKLAIFYVNNGIFSPNDISSTNETLFTMILEQLPQVTLVKACLAVKDVRLTTLADESLLAMALVEQCDSEVIAELYKLCQNCNELRYKNKRFDLAELIALHPESDNIAMLFSAKDGLSAEPTPLTSNNPFSFHFRLANIPPKDWRFLLGCDGNLEESIRAYQVERMQLIDQLRQLYDQIIALSPTEIHELTNIEQLKQSAPNRSLQTRIQRLQEMLSSEMPSPIVYQPEKLVIIANVENSTYNKNLSFHVLKSALGLTQLLNHNCYFLVTHQLDTLIHGITDDRLAPFKKIFFAPRINAKSGLKDIKARHITATIRIDGEVLTLPLVYCMKANTNHRIVVAQLLPEHGDKIILFPVRWLNNGFHDERYNGISHFEGGSVVTTEPESSLKISRN
jgi:ankyrin repeat protein